MRRGRVIAALSATALVAAAITATTATSSAQPSTAAGADNTSYLVLTKKGADVDAVAASLTKQGATVRGINRQIGLITVSTKKTNFRTSGRAVSGVSGVAADRSIGKAPDRKVVKIERENLVTRGAKGQASAKKPKGPKADPLDGNLWGMRMIKADQAHKISLGDKRVTVGVMDTGVQGDHPDIAPNFDWSLSRNFAPDHARRRRPVRGAELRRPGRQGRRRPRHPRRRHHRRGRLNGYGVSGVAPNGRHRRVSAGQDSGYFFPDPTVNALVYAGDVRHRRGQHELLRRPVALQLRRRRPGGLSRGAGRAASHHQGDDAGAGLRAQQGRDPGRRAGNNHEDLANPRVDDPARTTARTRTPARSTTTAAGTSRSRARTCSAVALGPRGKKSDFSNYSTEPISGDRVLRSRWLVPRRLRHRHLPERTRT